MLQCGACCCVGDEKYMYQLFILLSEEITKPCTSISDCFMNDTVLRDEKLKVIYEC